jgi:hypothetical protein
MLSLKKICVVKDQWKILVEVFYGYKRRFRKIDQDW